MRWLSCKICSYKLPALLSANIGAVVCKLWMLDQIDAVFRYLTSFSLLYDSSHCYLLVDPMYDVIKGAAIVSFHIKLSPLPTCSDHGGNRLRC